MTAYRFGVLGFRNQVVTVNLKPKTEHRKMQTRFKQIRNILVLILVLNWLVAAAKIIYGYITGSSAMGADGFHSFADGTSNIIGLIAVSVASRPVDSDHPYGHKKYETFAAIIVAILLFLISFNIIRGGMLRFVNPVVPDVTLGSFIVMMATLSVNTGVFFYEKFRAKELLSDILAADAQHTKSDILISISVVCTLIAVRLGFPLMDAVVSMLIALFIAYSGFEILKHSSDVLCDRAVIPAEDIRREVLKIEGVGGCHNIRTRGRQDDIHVDLHITVHTDMPTGKAHDLSHKIQDIIKERIEGVTDVSIHIEPSGSSH